MEAFRKGDFIRIKTLKNYPIENYSIKNINIFEISEIEHDFVSILNGNINIHINDVDSIPINGKDDLQIYYDPIICASIVEKGNSIPVRNKDYTYYYKSFNSSTYQNKNFQELIKELGLSYVHEVQHFLIDKFQDNGLKIKRF